jgi:6-phosphogluconolactonase
MGPCRGGLPGGWLHHPPVMLPYSPDAVAEALVIQLDGAAAARGRATLAIPGGRTPGPTLTALARICDPFLRARLHLLWLDERALPPGDAQRNDAATVAAWQQGGPLPAFVHAMPAEAGDLHAAAASYAETLDQACAGAPLDACLVGFGEDGHVASLFPLHPGLRELATVFPVFDSPKPPAQRLTLGMGVLHRAGLLAVLALGPDKGRVAKRAWQGPDARLPVSLLPQERCLWYLDDEAARAAR